MSLPSKRVNNKFWVFLSLSGKRFRMWCVTFLNHRLFFERISSILICCFSNGVAFFLHQPINMSITSSQITGLLHSLFRLTITTATTSKLALLVLCEGNPSMTGGFPSQRASNMEIISGLHTWAIQTVYIKVWLRLSTLYHRGTMLCQHLLWWQMMLPG